MASTLLKVSGPSGKGFTPGSPSARLGERREPNRTGVEGRQGSPLGTVHVRPVHRADEEPDALQRRGEPARVLRATRDPAHEFLRLAAAPPILRRRTGGLGTPGDARAGGSRRRPGSP